MMLMMVLLTPLQVVLVLMECEKVLTILQQRIKAMEYERKIALNKEASKKDEYLVDEEQVWH
jgi:hypothetical protein